MATRNANARWSGNLQDGEGTMRMGGGWEGPFTFKSRFEEGEGTNPEELIAAAHAGCYSMQFSADLASAGYDPQSVKTEANVHLRAGDAGARIARIDLVVRASVQGIEPGEFQRIAAGAKDGCPVSKALAAVDEITLDAALET